MQFAVICSYFLLKKDNKKHNIYANIVVEYVMPSKINKKDYEELLNDDMSPDDFFYQTNLRGETVYYQLSNFYFNSEVSEKLISNNQIKQFSTHNVDKLIEYIETIGPSGLEFHKINYLKIQYSKGNKTHAGSYIPTPAIIKLKMV